jgi:hypothetical protein
MSKVITSPVARFAGTVTLKDPLLLPDAITWEKAAARADAMLETTVDAEGNSDTHLKADYTNSERQGVLLEGFRAVVETWNLENFDPDNPPMSPKADVNRLFTWLVGGVFGVYYGAETPNE